MALPGPSLLSLAAAGLYGIVVLACLVAAVMATKLRQPPAHGRVWAGIALAFVLLAAMRVAGLEELIRASFRELLAVDGVYDERRSIQRPLAAGVVVLAGAAFGWAVLRRWRAVRGRRELALALACAGVAIMIMLLALRFVSLHQVDMLLYGPAKLNWVVDLGASLLVLGSAAFYFRLLTQRR